MRPPLANSTMVAPADAGLLPLLPLHVCALVQLRMPGCPVASCAVAKIASELSTSVTVKGGDVCW